MLNSREVLLLRFLITETSDLAEVELANAVITATIVTKDSLVRNLIVICLVYTVDSWYKITDVCNVENCFKNCTRREPLLCTYITFELFLQH